VSRSSHFTHEDSFSMVTSLDGLRSKLKRDAEKNVPPQPGIEPGSPVRSQSL
jgi:hypothetical protein